jgi:hypothetical protein
MMIRSALFWGITRRRVVILYRRFGTTYRSHLQASRSPRYPSWTSGRFKMLPIRCPETSVKMIIRRRVIPQKSSDLFEAECVYCEVRTDCLNIFFRFILFLKYALGQVFLPILRFSSFHQCTILIFMYIIPTQPVARGRHIIRDTVFCWPWKCLR